MVCKQVLCVFAFDCLLQKEHLGIRLQGKHSVVRKGRGQEILFGQLFPILFLRVSFRRMPLHVILSRNIGKAVLVQEMAKAYREYQEEYLKKDDVEENDEVEEKDEK